MGLRVDGISKTYGDHQVLSRATFVVGAGQKVGLVGANGAGKSTLLRIIMGEEQADDGTVWLAPGAEIGYLPQALHDADALTVAQLLARALGEVVRVEARLRSLEQRMATAGDALDALLAEYGLLSDRYERLGGYSLEYRTREVLAGLQVDHIAQSRPVQSLSGGEKSRLGLAALLLRSPDLLLLDEPTNHLDFAALAWLERTLVEFKGALLVVSHDRQFLNQVAARIVEIDEHSKETRHYAGNYDFYAQAKAAARAKWETEYWAQQEEIWELRKLIKSKARQVGHPQRAPRDGDKYIIYFKAQRVDDAVARNIRNAEERLRRLEEDALPKPPRPLVINPSFDPATLASRFPLVVSGVAKGYGGQSLLTEVDLTVRSDSRVVIVGPNGAGKTTLLRLLAGMEQPDAGVVERAAGVVLGYLDQEQETLAQEGTLFERFRAGRAGDAEEFTSELLAYGLFAYPDLAKPVRTLSVGQKRKLQLATLLTVRANLLLLDEPTNHLSLDVVEEFEAALRGFAGPVVAVSHDRRFIEGFAQEIWEVAAGRVRVYLGGWEEYQARMGIR